MKNYATKLAVLGLMGAIFAIPAASQADSLRINLLGLHIAIGHDHCAPAPLVVECFDWRWRRDHGYADWVWYREHPECHVDRSVWLRDQDRVVVRDREVVRVREGDRGRDRDRGREDRGRESDRGRDHDRR